MNILFTCGGTAGHINPAVALARLFEERHPGSRVLFVGADGGMETKLVPKEGYEIRTVTITNFRRSLTPAAIAHNVKTVLNMNKSKGQAKVILDEFEPDLVVGTGGYASFPVVSAAAKRGIPTAVHESNAVPGLTTKTLSKVVNTVMVGFEASRSHYDTPEKVVVTGTPVRGDFFRYTRKEARAQLGITDERPLLLSFFGSLGATVMNDLTVEFLAHECREGAPFHHIHGAGRDYTRMHAALTQKGVSLDGTGVELREYIYDMPLCMAAADLVICRAGASTIAELSALNKPAILVPSPNVVADHQTKNAKLLSDRGAATLLPERDCEGKPEVLFAAAADLLNHPEKRADMSRALGEMATGDVGERIYETLMGTVKKK